MRDTVKCGTCSGKGRVRISGVYAQTLRILRRQTSKGKAVVANRDILLFGCQGTALSNRLAWLEQHGFARSKRHGRERQYRAA